MTEVEQISALLERLAERVSPDEIDMVPAYSQACVDGKIKPAFRERKPGAVVGGLNMLGFDVELLQILGALTDSIGLVKLVLPVLGSLGAQAVIDRLRGGKRVEALPPGGDPSNVSEALEALARALEKRGLDKDKARQIGAETLLALSEQPGAAELLLKRLG